MVRWSFLLALLLIPACRDATGPTRPPITATVIRSSTDTVRADGSGRCLVIWQITSPERDSVGYSVGEFVGGAMHWISYGSFAGMKQVTWTYPAPRMDSVTVRWLTFAARDIDNPALKTDSTQHFNCLPPRSPVSMLVKYWRK